MTRIHRILECCTTRYLLPVYFCIFFTVSLPCFAAGGQQPVTSPSRTIARSDLAADGRALEPALSAGLRPELVWKRTLPNTKALDGPVLYQLLLNASGSPGTVPVFDTNPRHLINSPITVNSGNVAIGGMSISGGTGIITFANGQTFPGNSSGTVTSLSPGAGISLNPSPITTTGSIGIADGGV